MAVRTCEFSVFSKSFPFVVGATTVVGVLHRDQQDWVRAPPSAGRTFSPGAGRPISTSTWFFTLISYSGPQLVVRPVMLTALERRTALGMRAACARHTWCVHHSVELLCAHYMSIFDATFMSPPRIRTFLGESMGKRRENRAGPAPALEARAFHLIALSCPHLAIVMPALGRCR